MELTLDEHLTVLLYQRLEAAGVRFERVLTGVTGGRVRACPLWPNRTPANWLDDAIAQYESGNVRHWSLCDPRSFDQVCEEVVQYLKKAAERPSRSPKARSRTSRRRTPNE